MSIEWHSDAAPAAPTITQVVDNLNNDLRSSVSTSSSMLTLSGSGSAAAVLILKDNGAPIGTASITVNGTWAIKREFALGAHSFTVNTLDTDESAAWQITIAAA